MVKEIERAGIPVVHMCTVTPISMTVGANRLMRRNMPCGRSWSAALWKPWPLPLRTKPSLRFDLNQA